MQFPQQSKAPARDARAKSQRAALREAPPKPQSSVAPAKKEAQARQAVKEAVAERENQKTLGWLEVTAGIERGAPFAYRRWRVKCANGMQYEGRLDADGHVRIPSLQAGEATVWIDATEADNDLELGSAAATDEIDLLVTDEDGHPLRGHRFVVTGANGRAEGMLDDEGRARVAGLKKGDYHIRIFFAEQAPAPSLELVQAHETLSVVLVDANGTAIAGRGFIFTDARGMEHRGTLDDQGSTLLTGLAPGAGKLRWVPDASPEPPATPEPALGWVDLAFTDSSGSPFAALRLTLLDASGGQHLISPDASGHARVTGLAPGPAKIVLAASS